VTEGTTGVISLLDENNIVAMTWTLQNAIVSMMTDPGNRADANERTIELIELRHEGVSIT
jgi:hypothetical protein